VNIDGKNILIDASMDMRFQLLREGIKNIDVILLTHHHSDHICGLDDLRPISCKRKGDKILCMGNAITVESIKSRFPYFFHYEQKGGGVPEIEICEIKESVCLFNKKELQVIPVPVFHGKIQILGYRIGNMAYITDASFIPEESYSLLKGLDVLIINALRKRPHETHFSYDEVKAESERIKAKRVFITHICHDLMHSELVEMSKESLLVPAYDGLKVFL